MIEVDLIRSAIIELWKAGNDTYEIAEKIGYSEWFVYNHLWRLRNL